MSAMHDELGLLQSLGFTLPSPAYIVGVILFGLIGMVAFYIGRHQSRPRIKWLGVALMFYPYVVPSTWLMYAIGVALSVGVWMDRT